MRSLTVQLESRSYSIHIGEGLLDRLNEFIAPLDPTSVVIVTNDVVGPLYAQRARQALSNLVTKIVQLPDGESSKRWSSVEHIVDEMVRHRVDRRGVVIALGGGVIGDIAGFAASIYMRGVRHVQVPTTLLSQVDSSVGGKTGINHSAGKNLIGSFHQPAAVISDTETLQTLPARQISAGLAEVIKHGLLADKKYFAQINTALELLRSGDAASLGDAIARSCEIKAAIVGRDETERGERALLNLGHTFGHAIESLTGYAWLHGEAVGCGCVLAAQLSSELKLLSPHEVQEVRDVVTRAGLPTRVDGLSASDAVEVMRADKKADAGHLRFIVLESIGKASQRAAPDSALRATLAAGGFV